ncbi:3'-5' exonuclease [Spongiibacter sp. KMU-158]|uniref:3'-5' exonuclease n=1 Tax=Spongiibacter pelagi TaxID=2760804 RepID=A0A927C0D8_9GAMM|nr:3'-5' exonuclease [Spongiibacter pelagi]
MAWQRWRYRNAVSPELHACWQRPPQLDKFLVVDIETNSLDAKQGEVVSLAWVAVNANRIVLKNSEHLLVLGNQSVSESAGFHLLRDCERSQGLPVKDVMALFLAAAAGRTLVFHYAGLDMAFLNTLSRKLYAAPLLLPFIDTLEIEKQKMQRRDQPIVKGDLRLGACRKRYGLPEYPAHNAFNDALATAELLLAQKQVLA